MTTIVRWPSGRLNDERVQGWEQHVTRIDVHYWSQHQRSQARCAAWAIATAMVISVGASRLLAQPIAERANQVIGTEITPQQQAAVQKGLAWLARQQDKDGSYKLGGTKHAGITALAGLAFMEGGNLPNRGEYGSHVDRAVSFVISSTQESGLIASDASHGAMYGHGFATLFLAEVYGMTGDEAVRDKLQKAVRLIQQAQNPEGGWRYQPVPVDADISVTICQVMALRAARDAGIKVEKTIIDNAIGYVRKCQNADGGFSYMAAMRGSGGSGFARSAAGVASLYYAGVFEGDDLERGLKYLSQFVPGKRGGAAAVADFAGMEGHYFYGHYYAAQSMFLAGGQYWATYYPAIRDQLIARQNRAEGRWDDSMGADYGTSMALLILQKPNRYLPVYSGKGPGD